MSDYAELKARLSIKADMIQLGEKIEWGSDSAIMREAAAALTALSEQSTALAAQVAELTRERDYADWERSELNDREESTICLLENELGKILRRAEAAEAKVKRLEEALRNMIGGYETYGYDSAGKPYVLPTERQSSWIQRARAALQEDKSHE